MSNKYTGEFTVKIGKTDYSLVYDWEALGQIQTEFGSNAVGDIFSSTPQVVAQILAIGLKKKHPEMSAEKIISISPPIKLMAKAIDTAILYANWGPDEAERIIREMQGAAVQVEDALKKKIKSPKQ